MIGLGAILLLIAIVLTVVKCKINFIIYGNNKRRPRTMEERRREVDRIDPIYQYEDGSKVLRTDIETQTSDGLTLRGFRFKYIPPGVIDSDETLTHTERVILYTHGTTVFLPYKMAFFNQTCHH